MKVSLGNADEFEDGAVQIRVVQGIELGIARWGNRFYAIRNECADQAGPVCEGSLRPHLAFDIRQAIFAIADGPPVISCPWHFWEFDVATGRALRGLSRLKTFVITVEDGEVYVDMPRNRVTPMRNPNTLVGESVPSNSPRSDENEGNERNQLARNLRPSSKQISGPQR